MSDDLNGGDPEGGQNLGEALDAIAAHNAEISALLAKLGVGTGAHPDSGGGPTTPPPGPHQ